MMSTLSLLMSCAATSDARFGLDWLSRLRISTRCFSPATTMPSPKNLVTSSATHFEGSPNAAIGPVSGVICPILIVFGAARDDWKVHGDVTRPAPPAAAIFKSLRRWLLNLATPPDFDPPSAVIVRSSLFAGSYLFWPVGFGPQKSDNGRQPHARLLWRKARMSLALGILHRAIGSLPVSVESPTTLNRSKSELRFCIQGRSATGQRRQQPSNLGRGTSAAAAPAVSHHLTTSSMPRRLCLPVGSAV